MKTRGITLTAFVNPKLSRYEKLQALGSFLGTKPGKCQFCGEVVERPCQAEAELKLCPNPKKT